MKKSIFFVAFVLMSISCFSQDLMSFKRGDARLEVIVTEITPTLVRYKLFSDPNQRIYFVYKEDVAGIMYKDGRVETFTQSGEQVKVNDNENQQSSSTTVTQVNPPPVSPQPVTTWSQTNVITQSAGRGGDVVYLRNGSVIRGTIIEQVPNVSMKIQTADGNIFAYPMSDIERIVKETPAARSYQPVRGSYRTGLKRGYRGIVDFGYYFGDNDYQDNNHFNFSFINGYQATPHFSFGFGTGIHYYPDREQTLIPFFNNFKVNFINRRVSPYFSIDIGYAFNASDDFNGVGVFVIPTLGASFKTSERGEIHFGLAFHAQEWEWTDWRGYKYNDTLGAFTVKFGVSF